MNIYRHSAHTCALRRHGQRFIRIILGPATNKFRYVFARFYFRRHSAEAVPRLHHCSAISWLNIDNAVGVCIERALLQIVEIRVQMHSPTRCYKTRYDFIYMAQDWRVCFDYVRASRISNKQSRLRITMMPLRCPVLPEICTSPVARRSTLFACP